jgi:methyl-accepting chemotaxis protein
MMNFSNVKIGKRIALGFGIVVLISVIPGIYCMNQIKKADDADTLMYEKTAVPLGDLAHIMENFESIRINISELLLVETDAAQKEAINEIRTLRSEIDKYSGHVEATLLTENGKKAFKRYSDAFKEYISDVDEMIRLVDGKHKAELRAQITGKSYQTAEQAESALRELVGTKAEIAKQTSDNNTVIANGAITVMTISLSLSLLISALLGFFITRSVSRPISAGVETLSRISQGDISHEVSADLRGRKDELGELARAMQTMTESLRSMMGEVSGGMNTLASAATELSAVSRQTTSSVKTMSEKTATLAAAAEESSANTVSVATNMEEATTNLSSVASATEQMSATIAEIASNAEKARSISSQATVQAQAISTMMQQLGQAAQEIGKVTETITDISSQTNLLALNATIEAARAGAAGKGFAVVANEIKELARQTASATEDIKGKIGGVQASAGGAISDIEKITGVIGEMGHIVTTIAAAIEEQATVTKEVAQNIAQASIGMGDANERVSQTASVSKSIAQDVAAVNSAANDIRQGGDQVQASVVELSTLAEQLTEVVRRFKVDNAAGASVVSRTVPGRSVTAAAAY